MALLQEHGNIGGSFRKALQPDKGLTLPSPHRVCRVGLCLEGERRSWRRGRTVVEGAQLPEGGIKIVGVIRAACSWRVWLIVKLFVVVVSRL